MDNLNGREKVTNLLKFCLNSVMSGVLLAMAGTAYLLCPLIDGSKIIGSVMFCFGLYFIIVLNYKLFTGLVVKVPFLKANQWPSLPICFLFNGLGCLLAAGLFSLSPLNDKLVAATQALMTTKLANSPLQVFCSAIFCGLCIAFAILGAQEAPKKSLSATLAILFPITIFVLCGFEHCVANLFYIFMSKTVWSGTLVVFLLVDILGNFIGGIVAPYLKKWTDTPSKTTEKTEEKSESTETK